MQVGQCCDNVSTVVLTSQELPIHNGAGAVPDPYLLREYRGGALELIGCVACDMLACPSMPKNAGTVFRF